MPPLWIQAKHKALIVSNCCCVQRNTSYIEFGTESHRVHSSSLFKPNENDTLIFRVFIKHTFRVLFWCCRIHLNMPLCIMVLAVLLCFKCLKGREDWIMACCVKSLMLFVITYCVRLREYPVRGCLPNSSLLTSIWRLLLYNTVMSHFCGKKGRRRSIVLARL